MKKTLVALAAIASVSAFAQTTVSITGNLDFAGARFGGTMNGNKGTTFTTGNGTASTSSINFTATEDIGGGNKITAFYGLDPRTFSNDGTTSTNIIGSTTTGANAVLVTGIGRHEAYVQASGAFGSLKVGAPNAMGLDANGMGQPLGTGVGSGYATNTNTLVARSAAARYSRSARFDSPVMNGFSAHLLFAPGGDQANVNDASSTYGAFQFPNARRATEAALRYSNGPLNVIAVNIRGAAMTNVAGYYAYSNEGVTTSAIAATNYNTVAANYKLGNTTIYAQVGNGGSINSPSTAAALASDKLNRYGVKHTMGAVDLAVASTKVATAAAGVAGVVHNVTGFNGTYNLSKTSAVYLGYEKWDSGTVAVTSNTNSGARTITSLGLRKSF